MNIWQHLPEHIDPVIFSLGSFVFHWYALCFLLGLFFAFSGALLLKKHFHISLLREEVLDLFLSLFLGAIVGGHLGYALFYSREIFLSQPVSFFLPYDTVTHSWRSLSGMSFHGGLLGVILVLGIVARKKNVSFLALADLASLVAPIALFFGRIGNFLALELYGRRTASPLGMIFPEGGSDPRHPSQLYEALGEGVCLFFILFFLRKKCSSPGQLSALFIVGYSSIRFGIEFFREPDPGIDLLFGWLTRGQLFSSLMGVAGFLFFLWLKQKNRARMEGL